MGHFGCGCSSSHSHHRTFIIIIKYTGHSSLFYQQQSHQQLYPTFMQNKNQPASPKRIDKYQQEIIDVIHKNEEKSMIHTQQKAPNQQEYNNNYSRKDQQKMLSSNSDSEILPERRHISFTDLSVSSFKIRSDMRCFGELTNENGTVDTEDDKHILWERCVEKCLAHQGYVTHCISSLLLL
jgi:hypothetical protein